MPSIEHMDAAAQELSFLASATGRPELRDAAKRAQRRARAVREGATLHDLAAAGDPLTRVLVTGEAS